MLISIFDDQQDFQTLHMSLKYLLYKKIMFSPSFDRSVNPESIISAFFECIRNFGKVMKQFVQEARVEPMNKIDPSDMIVTKNPQLAIQNLTEPEQPEPSTSGVQAMVE